jgi:ligand-binding SRPBCC domain-containing protein
MCKKHFKPLKMRIELLTRIPNRTISETFNKFDGALFLKLAPPLPISKLIRFDGCKTNDVVALKIRIFFKWHLWESQIISNVHTESEINFVDEGRILPFFLSSWKHRHRIVKENNDVLIIDDIEFFAHNKVITLLSFPILYLMFAMRKPIYRKEL